MEPALSKTNPSQTIYVGHLNPDSDSIMAATVAAYMFEGQAGRFGHINNETKFLIERFRLKQPTLIKSFKDRSFVLLDFNQSTQAPKELKTHQIKGIIDHHALRSASFHFNLPIDIHIKPWGSTCTVLYEMAKRRDIVLNESYAGALLGGIISDTLNLQSPTTTNYDRRAAAELKVLANIDRLDHFAQNMFKAKSDVSHLSPKDIITTDFKEYTMHHKKVAVGVHETITPELIFSRTKDIQEALTQLKKENNYDYLFFVVVDTKHLKSKMFLTDIKEEHIALSAFPSHQLTEHIIDLKNLVSRKRQIAPKLQASIKSFLSH